MNNLKAAIDAAFLVLYQKILSIAEKKYTIDVMHFYTHRLNFK
jgi:hypothetical protein